MVIRIIFLLFFSALLYSCDVLETPLASHKCECHCKCEDENDNSEIATFDCETGRKCSASNGSICIAGGDDQWAGTLTGCFRAYVPIR